MITAKQIIERAYVLIGFIATSETLDDADAEIGLSALNSMIDGWNAYRVAPEDPIEAPPAIAKFEDLATDYALAPGYQRAFEYSLAEELAIGMRPADPKIVRAAAVARRAIRQTRVVVPTLDFCGLGVAPIQHPKV